MPASRNPNLLPLAVAVLLLAAGSCQLFVDLEGLEDHSCPPGKKACPGGCAEINDPTTGCSDALSCNPCPIPHAVAICDETLRCSFNRDSCNKGWADCDDDRPGCETDLAHDPKNCAECGHVCEPVENGVPGCAAGKCVASRCLPGFEDCDPDPQTCERQIWTDTDCATCNSPCAEGTHCDRGVCL